MKNLNTNCHKLFKLNYSLVGHYNVSCCALAQSAIKLIIGPVVNQSCGL